MCGDYNSVLGMDIEEPINRFMTKIPRGRFEPSIGPATLSGLAVEIDDATGLAVRVKAVRLGGVLQPGRAALLVRVREYWSEIGSLGRIFGQDWRRAGADPYWREAPVGDGSKVSNGCLSHASKASRTRRLTTLAAVRLQRFCSWTRRGTRVTAHRTSRGEGQEKAREGRPPASSMTVCVLTLEAWHATRYAGGMACANATFSPGASAMPAFICTACGTQYPPSDKAAGPVRHLRGGAPVRAARRPDLDHAGGAGGEPPQQLPPVRARRHRHRHASRLSPSASAPSSSARPHGNILWDCISLLDAATVTLIKGLGGLKAIAISHPHFYTTMGAWSRAFGGVPIHLHARDKAWIMQPDPAVKLWEGETLNLLPDVTLVRCGGHFPGGTVLHWAQGRGGPRRRSAPATS